MKTCFKCKVEKPLSEFYKHKQMADGHLGKCKECARDDAIEHRKHNDSVREYDRMRSKRPERKAHAARNGKRWRKNNPEKVRAQLKARRAVASGKIERQHECCVCGAEEHLHMHHHDYSKPLDIVWLCARCHHRGHALANQFCVGVE